MKRRATFLLALAGLSILSFGFVLRVTACTPSNTVCRASGGCSVPCVNGTSGTSAEIISASQVAQCSPSNMSNCAGSGGMRSAVFITITQALIAIPVRSMTHIPFLAATVRAANAFAL